MRSSTYFVRARDFGQRRQPPTPEWGTLLLEGKDFILSTPHLSRYPGIAIMLTALAFNLTGDGLRDRYQR